MKGGEQLARPERQSHHLAWQEGVERVRVSIAKLEDFIKEEILSRGEPTTGKLAVNDPLALADFLALNGEPLHEAANKISELLELLRNSLF